MLFAVVPSRNALPDSPPIGWWIDVTVVLSVIDVLGIPLAISFAAGGGTSGPTPTRRPNRETNLFATQHRSLHG
jgi:hypothetical protein